MAQLDHRRKSLPEHAEIARLQSQRAHIAASLVAADTSVVDLELEQTEAESDLEPVRQRLARNQHRIADGTVVDPKALSALIEEVGHLQKRISDLEDAELEIMEQLEAAQAARAQLRSRAELLDQQIASCQASRDQQLVTLDDEVATKIQHRSSIVPQIPGDLMALYDKVSAGHGGLAVAEVRQRRCTGCQLEINAAELRAFAAAAENEVLRCEECSRILIRTERSGL